MRNAETLPNVEEPLIDTTVAIPKKSKRTERQQKKRQEKASRVQTTFFDLPTELLLSVFSYLRPSDIFNISRVNKSFHNFIFLQHEDQLAQAMIQARYPTLYKCFQLPVLLKDVDESVHAALMDEERQELLNIHKKSYQHIKAPDPKLICTCLTCSLNWNFLCVIIDFAVWQNNLDQGFAPPLIPHPIHPPSPTPPISTLPLTDHSEPIPIIDRGRSPRWNRTLINASAATVTKALHSKLWHSRILEAHLDSTVRSIKRHGANKGNQRKRFRMEVEDVRVGTDAFLERSGPPTMDIPYHRDGFYMLEGMVFLSPLY